MTTFEILVWAGLAIAIGSGLALWAYRKIRQNVARAVAEQMDDRIRQTMTAEAAAIKEKMKADLEELQVTIQSATTERMKLLSTLRTAEKRKVTTGDPGESDEPDAEPGDEPPGGESLERIFAHPFIRGMAEANQIDVDALLAGDAEQWSRAESFLSDLLQRGGKGAIPAGEKRPQPAPATKQTPPDEGTEISFL